MADKHCLSCGSKFHLRPQSPKQHYCSAPACQRERRRREQKKRRKRNPDQRSIDAQYLRDWIAKNPGYWKRYRAAHPEYTAQNRLRQRERSRARIAKEAVCPPEALCGGRYRLIPASASDVANEAAWIVDVTVVAGPAGTSGRYCK